MPTIQLSKAILDSIDACVEAYSIQLKDYERLANVFLLNLMENPTLSTQIHSTKKRIKDPEHLRDKLNRKATQCAENGLEFDITPDNYCTKIDDLAGVRLLHLYSRQMSEIHPAIIGVFDEYHYKLCSKPEANTWDIENEAFFKSLGLKAKLKPSLYTSVHYILKSNQRKEMRIELQVRTLAEELWGEVSHKINYPHETSSIACKEQLCVLARIASGCTRLVDSIYATQTEIEATH